MSTNGTESVLRRVYTVTIKPVYKPFKGQHKTLFNVLIQYTNRINAYSFKYVFEDSGTPNEHIHALIECPFIANKSEVAKSFFGYHIHSNIIRFHSEDDIKVVWSNYINKQFSDSDKFERAYGNMFDI